MGEQQDGIDQQIRAACDAAAFERAASLVIEHYGPELLGFLLGHLRDREAASEVFAEFSAAFWVALPRFEWRCSVRTWAYKLLRRTAARHREHARRRAQLQPLAQLSQLSQAVERVHTATLAYQRTDVKDRFQELRTELPEEDRMLLVLRVDRGLSWLELAEITLTDDLAPDETRLKTEAARLRKRFQLVKVRLRALLADAGLLDR